MKSNGGQQLEAAQHEGVKSVFVLIFYLKTFFFFFFFFKSKT